MNYSDLHNFSAHQLTESFKNGSLDAEQIALYFLKRIRSLDGEINAFLEIFDDVIEEAKQLDQKRSRGEPLGRLAGVPISIKDIIHVRGKKTTCASKFLEKYTAPFNSTVVEHLQKEDALLIGKVNLDEFGMGALGANSAFGITRNPWNTSYFSGGSSSGSAASVSARMCPLSLGSDTGGSTRLPASFCGIYGFKPSYGSVSRYGVVAFASSLDQVGLFSHHPEDLKLLFSCISQNCIFDAQWRKTDCTPLTHNLKNISIGWTPNLFQESNSNVSICIQKAINQLKKAGAKLVPLSHCANTWSNALLAYHVLSSSEASTNLARFDGIRFGSRVTHSSFSETISKTRSSQFGKEVKARILTGTYFLSSMKHENYYLAALEERKNVKQIYHNIFQQVDFLLMPSTSSTAIPIGATLSCKEQHLLDIFTSPVNLAGLSSMSFPVTICDNGLPIGCQLIAPKGKDYSILEIASQIGSLFDLPAPILDIVK